MTGQKNYKKTLLACYLGFVTQAITANFAPLLFLTFKSTYGITLDKIALIPLVFYFTQLLTDLAATKFADRIGYRICVTASQVLSAVGLVLMAILPEITPTPFAGLLISVALYAIGSGLIEVLVSPIVEACPFENKDGMMSLLHSFFCWGSMGVILGSTVFFAFFGVENWKILTVIWALAGDLGASASPTMVGSISEMAGGNLKTGLLFATVFPVVLVIGLIVLSGRKQPLRGR